MIHDFGPGFVGESASGIAARMSATRNRCGHDYDVIHEMFITTGDRGQAVRVQRTCQCAGGISEFVNRNFLPCQYHAHTVKGINMSRKTYIYLAEMAA